MENPNIIEQKPTEHSPLGITALVGTSVSALIGFYGFAKAIMLGFHAARTAQAAGIEPQFDEATAAKFGMLMLLGAFGAFISSIVAIIAIVKDRGVKKISTAIATLVISALGIVGFILITILGAMTG